MTPLQLPAAGRLVVVPMYRCAPQVERVIGKLAALAPGTVDAVVLVDNQSPDDTLPRAVAAAAASARPELFTVLRNEDNYGLGGSQKVGFEAALRAGAEHVVILHGDDQAHVPDLLAMLSRLPGSDADALLGARFLRGAVLDGYSTFRTAGNRVFDLLFSLALRRRVHDLGSGLNVYAVRALASRYYLRYADDLTFNVHLLIGQCLLRQRLAWHPITWRESDQQSNVRLLEQGLRTLRLVQEAALHPERCLRDERRQAPRARYASAVQWPEARVGQGVTVEVPQ